MRKIRLQAENGKRKYTAVVSNDLTYLSSSKVNEAMDLIEFDDEWSLYFDEMDIPGNVEFVFKKEDGEKTLIPDHVIYWDENDIIRDTDFFKIL